MASAVRVIDSGSSSTASTNSTSSNTSDNLVTSDIRRRPIQTKCGRARSVGGGGGGGGGMGTLSAFFLRPCRAAASTSRTRFMEDGFDLDLAYVTKRIIVHGVPNESADPMYEDPRTEVRRLLDKYHFNHYKVYNFASELTQMSPPTGEQKVDGRTERYPFTDDTCPPLESVVDFCENAKAWLDHDPQNVVSLHCKAGKGRAGIMAACLMVRMGETADEAVAKYDATQGSDLRGQTAMSQRAWVFLYERLIREVWGLRDTIGTVSGRNPSLRAPPRLSTILREVSLEFQSAPRRSRFRPVLYNPSCAVYQQTPAGKAMVHRAKMPTVQSGKRRHAAHVFAAELPRSVVVEGTFQVVVSAATGVFGVGKNVLDVWCNTTFLDEDGGQEIFNFTANDLPRGPLATRLLAAGVRVVLTHTPPDAASPVPRRSKSESHAVGLFSSSAASAAAAAAAAATRGRESSLLSTSNRTNPGELAIAEVDDGDEIETPDTEEDEELPSDDAAEAADESRGGALGVGGDGSDGSADGSSRRLTQLGDVAPVASTVRPGLDRLQVLALALNEVMGSNDAAAAEAAAAAVAASRPDEAPPRAQMPEKFPDSARGSLVRLGSMNSAGDGCTNMTPTILDGRPSPLRSCPRAAVSRSDSFFGELTDDKAKPGALPLRSGSLIWGPGASTSTESMTPMIVSTERPPRGGFPPLSANKTSESRGHVSGSRSASGGMFGINSNVAPPPHSRSISWDVHQTPPPLPPPLLNAAILNRSSTAQQQPRQRTPVSNGTGLGGDVDGSKRSSNINRGDGLEERKPWASLTIPASTTGDSAVAGPGAFGARTSRSSMLCWNAVDDDDDKVSFADPDGRAYDDHDHHHLADASSPSSTSDPADVSLSTCLPLPRPSPAVRKLLESAAERSFEDPPSCRQRAGSPFSDGVDTERSGGGDGSSFSDTDDEKASRVARALAGWVESGMGPRSPMPRAATPTLEVPVPTRRLIVRRSEGGETNMSSGRYIEMEGQLLAQIPPLKQRVWPPTRPVVAGEMEVHEALGPRDHVMASAPGRAMTPQRPGVRKWGSTGTSWGEEAKLALARKRLQWQKSRGGTREASESLRLHAAMVAKREAEILAIETDVKEAVRLLEERIARREKAEAALNRWRTELPPKAYDDVMSCLAGSRRSLAVT